MADDRDSEIYQITEEEMIIFEHDMDVFVTMHETGSTDFAATEKAVDERRKEDRRLEQEWKK